ncbi:NADH-quinone oxidoreductase subunit C [Streptomyces sp. NPDC050625]|uniref:NADH-quinone oxidoreductase subunit C n=1 Tax=Streptomyces sp. NPDC050625 TaxID=3154629 RepID=UPI003426C9C0
MTTVGWLPAPVEDLFGAEATAEESYEVLTVDVPPSSWLTALETARTTLSCTYFDWLNAVDEPGTGFRVSAHVVALFPVRRLLLRTTVPHETPVLASAVGVYAGARWHERETHEMFGVDFEGHPGLDHLLLPETFEGHPLRKDFVLASRVAKAWPGAKEPGESDHGGPKRRQMLPPGVPDPNEWGPLKGQLPPAPARPARATAGERPARAAGERPVRRARTAAQGSASQTPTPETAAAETAAATPAPVAETATPTGPARRARSASEGSASQRDQEPTSAQQQPAATAQTEPTGPAGPTEQPESTGTASAEPSTPGAPTRPSTRPTAARSADAPWHHARPAFDGAEPEPEAATEPKATTDREPEATPTSTPTSTPMSTSPEPAEAPAAEPPAPEGRPAEAPAQEESSSPVPEPEEPTPEEQAPAAGPTPEEQNRDDRTGGPQ